MKIDYTRLFKKEYKKLPQKLKIQFAGRIEVFRQDSFSSQLNNHALHHPFEGYRSINISGDYRALYYVEQDGTAVFIRIGTHSELYK